MMQDPYRREGGAARGRPVTWRRRGSSAHGLRLPGTVPRALRHTPSQPRGASSPPRPLRRAIRRPFSPVRARRNHAGSWCTGPESPPIRSAAARQGPGTIELAFAIFPRMALAARRAGGPPLSRHGAPVPGRTRKVLQRLWIYTGSGKDSAHRVDVADRAVGAAVCRADGGPGDSRPGDGEEGKAQRIGDDECTMGAGRWRT